MLSLSDYVRRSKKKKCVAERVEQCLIDLDKNTEDFNSQLIAEENMERRETLMMYLTMNKMTRLRLVKCIQDQKGISIGNDMNQG